MKCVTVSGLPTPRSSSASASTRLSDKPGSAAIDCYTNVTADTEHLLREAMAVFDEI
jgi:hypothetical protein